MLPDKSINMARGSGTLSEYTLHRVLSNPYLVVRILEDVISRSTVRSAVWTGPVSATELESTVWYVP